MSSVASNDFNFTSDLNSRREDWKVRVRVCRLWNVFNNRDTKKIITMEMVIVDEKGNYMHAVIWRNYVSKFKDIIPTMVRVLDEVPHAIPMHIFEFVNFSNLAERVRSDVPLTGEWVTITHDF
ncbi:Nucleic acid-binding protein [Corchorus olitorius]|uniref:Nucleic acid-binding protein n=1 Tax=Corchorus olitorius TaxID=93759 RepID=A0A1R3I792_9ROSI|nr:Nucleic acid-binding protein [Corchorus olitorius]